MVEVRLNPDVVDIGANLNRIASFPKAFFDKLCLVGGRTPEDVISFVFECLAIELNSFFDIQIEIDLFIDLDSE